MEFTNHELEDAQEYLEDKYLTPAKDELVGMMMKAAACSRQADEWRNKVVDRLTEVMTTMSNDPEHGACISAANADTDMLWEVVENVADAAGDDPEAFESAWDGVVEVVSTAYCEAVERCSGCGSKLEEDGYGEPPEDPCPDCRGEED